MQRARKSAGECYVELLNSVSLVVTTSNYHLIQLFCATLTKISQSAFLLKRKRDAVATGNREGAERKKHRNDRKGHGKGHVVSSSPFSLCESWEPCPIGTLPGVGLPRLNLSTSAAQAEAAKKPLSSPHHSPSENDVEVEELVSGGNVCLADNQMQPTSTTRLHNSLDIHGPVTISVSQDALRAIQSDMRIM